MTPAFWSSSRDLLRYWRPLLAAFGGADLNAACFGIGVGMLLPAIKLLTELENHQTLAQILLKIAEKPSVPASLREALNQVAPLLPTEPFWSFELILLVIMVMTVLGNVGRFFHEWLTLTVVMRMTMVWRARIMRRLVHAPYIDLLQKGSSEHLIKVLTDTEILSAGYRALMGRVLGESLKGIGGVTMALVINWRITLWALLCLPVVSVIMRKFGKIIRRSTKRSLQQKAKIVETIIESFTGILVVKSYNAEGYESRRFNRNNRNVFQQEMKARTARSLSSPVVEIASMVAIVTAASAAAWLIFRRGESGEEFIAVLGMLAAAAGAIKPLSNLHNQLHESSVAADRIKEVMSLPVEPRGKYRIPDEKALPRHHQGVDFKSVTFAYSGSRKPAVRDLSLHIDFGSEVAVVGGNGSGKSTLLNFLPRLLVPQQGQVLIDGIDISTVGLRSLRQQISIVTQQSVLFRGTIAQNIAYSRQDEPRSRIIEAAKQARADEFIQELPGGYDYELGEQGGGLSGGQRQRLCIARAILRDPPILILDEATSQIDAESEAKINLALRQIRQGRTIFIIAHRLSTVIDADRIVVMDEGQIIDQGTHTELLQRCRMYQLFTQTQLRSATTG
ncbi:MAG: ABC transporter ATP-binding protein [Phycisphaeraceae bacterium]|nr:ABC transporter ATP-binding protein [Phycisphaeraceae bacterium]